MKKKINLNLFLLFFFIKFINQENENISSKFGFFRNQNFYFDSLYFSPHPYISNKIHFFFHISLKIQYLFFFFTFKKVEGASQVWNNFPRNTEFYDDSVRNFSVLGSKCLEDSVKVILGLLPCISSAWQSSHGNPVIPKLDFITPAKYTFENFISNHRRIKEPEVLEMIVSFFFLKCSKYQLFFFFFKGNDP